MKKLKTSFLSLSPDDTLVLGEKLGKLLKGGETIALEGDLGGGKTLFTKGVALGLGIKKEVISPSFTIERQYETKSGVRCQVSGVLILHHFDFYRLENKKDALQFMLDEVYDNSQNIVIIEWAQNLPGVLPEERLEIIFHFVDENKRKIVFNPKGEKYQTLIQKIL